MPRHPLGLACLLLVGVLVHPGASAAVHLQKVVDHQTPMPRGTGNFWNLDFPSLDAGRVLFAGAHIQGLEEGVYRASQGNFEIVADLLTPVPGGASAFASFQGLSQDGELIVFEAYTSGDPLSQQGIYARSGGSLFVVVDEDTQYPGTSPGDRYLRFHSPVADGATVYFKGERAGQDAIHRYAGGALDLFFDVGVPIPGGVSTFDSFRFSAGDAGIAFAGSGMWNEGGIYRVVGGSVEVVADWTTPIPDASEDFTWFPTTPAVAGDRIVFHGGGAVASDGIYVHDGTGLSTLLQSGAPVPGSPGAVFAGFGGDIAVDGTNTAFAAYVDDGTGPELTIFADLDGQLQRVAGTSDPLDGKLPYSVGIGPEALDGNQVVFLASFEDYTQAIYLATLEELAPAPVPALPPALIGVLAALLVASSGTRLGRRGAA